MSQQAPATKAKGCVKLSRCAKFRAYYKVQVFQTLKNKQRKLGNRIRNHPNDTVAIARYEELYGKGTSQGVLARLTARGARRL